jgi:hypothetical protein
MVAGIAFVPSGAWAGPRPPHGVFSAGPAGVPVPADVLSHPFVNGVTVRHRWPDVEPFEGVYDWSHVDTEITRVAEAGKAVLLRIAAGGRNTPSWVLAAGVQTFSFVDSNSFRDTFGETLTIPVFWDPVFLAKKTQFIAAMGRRFAEHPSVRLVSASCANATTDDWNVPDSAVDVDNWLALGYTPDKLIEACKEIIDAAMTAFPDQLVLMAVGTNSRALDPDANHVARAVTDYARERYPERFIVQKNSLSATTPDPALTTTLGAWQIMLDHRPHVAGQMLWFVSNDSTCRMNGRVAPCDPVAVLRQAVTTGAHYGMLYQEIYQQDVRNPDLADVIVYAADLLSTPTTPTDVTGATTSFSDFTLSWSAATDDVAVVGYHVYRNGLRIATVAGTSYVDTGLKPASTYVYRVSAADAVGNESEPSRSVVKTPRPRR